MAVQFNYNNKCGEITLVQMHPGEEDRVFTLDLYQGNCFLIMIHEYKDEKGRDVEELFSFFTDKQHMLNCLGLDKKDKDSYNLYETPYQRFTKLRLNKAKYSRTKELVAAFAEAFSEITIEVYEDKTEGTGENG